MILNPNALLLLICIPVLLIFFLWREIVRAKSLQKLGDKQLIDHLILRVSYPKRRLKTVSWLIVLVMIIVALARPVWGVEPRLIQYEGSEIVFVVDVSLSMDAQDTLPSRLERALVDLSLIATSLGNANIGIVIFAGTNQVYLPFTSDLSLVTTFAQGISSNAISQQGTAIADALSSVLLNYPSQGSLQVILMSDGENHEWNTTATLEAFTEAQIPIHTLQYGTSEGALIPVYGVQGELTGYKTDANGVLVTTRVDGTLLELIAQTTGGRFFAPDSFGLDAFIQEIQTTALLETTNTRPIEQFSLFIFLGILILSMEIVLTESRATE